MLRFFVLATLLVQLSSATEAQILPDRVYRVGELYSDVGSVAVADFNGDGRPDIATLNFTSGVDEVSLLLAGDDCRFVLTEVDLLLANPLKMAVGDLDEDGLPDLVVTDSFTVVRIAFGDAEVGLTPWVTFPAGASPYGVAVVDIDDDGHLDVLTANWEGESASVLLGNGRGGLAPPQSHPVFEDPVDIAAADLDGDGDLDIVTTSAHFPGKVSVLLSDGMGGFAPSVDYRHSLVGGWTGKASALVDVNEDGHIDIVVSKTNNGVSVLLGNGTGTFATPYAIPMSNGYELVVVDADDDGHLDLVLGGVSPGPWLMRGDGTGVFSPPDRLYGATPSDGLAVADLNGDGRLDVVSGGFELVGIVFADSTGSLLHEAPQPFSSDELPGEAAFFDLNADGHLDVVVADDDEGWVAVLLADGSGGLHPPVLHAVGDDPASPVATDFDGDTHLDLIVPKGASGLAILLGDGGGGFGPATSYPVGYILHIATGDLDEDGAVDVIASMSAPDALTLLRGDGSGGLLPVETLATTGWQGFGPTAVTDLNGDDQLDVLAYDAPSGDLLVLLGDGAGGFPTSQPVDLNAIPRAILTEDLDADGDQDVVVPYLNGVQVLLGDGSGGFGAPNDHPDMLASYAALGDVDGDGVLDVVSVRNSTGTVSLMLGDGTGGFGPVSYHASGGLTNSVALQDVDGDGFTDVLSAGRILPYGSFQVLYNLGGPFVECGGGLPGTHGTPQLSATGTLEGDSTITLSLEGALENSSAWLVAGVGTLLAPLKGGTLVPNLDALLPPLPIGPSGSLVLAGPFPIGLPPGTPLAIQIWVPDPAGPVGFAASDGIVGITP